MSRTAIRTSAVTALKGATAAGDRVDDSRVTVPDASEMEDGPRIAVWTTTTDSELAAHSLVYDDDLVLRVTGYVTASDGPTAAAAVDDLEGEIKAALLSSGWVEQLNTPPARMRTESGADDGEILIGWVMVELTLRDRVEYERAGVDDFTAVDATTSPTTPSLLGPAWTSPEGA